MMKKRSISTALVTLLLSLVIWLGGCSCIPLLMLGDCSQPGETEAEVNRRHIRQMRIEQQEMMQDIDATLHLDQPSKLTERKIP